MFPRNVLRFVPFRPINRGHGRSAVRPHEGQVALRCVYPSCMASSMLRVLQYESGCMARRLPGARIGASRGRPLSKDPKRRTRGRLWPSPEDSQMSWEPLLQSSVLWYPWRIPIPPSPTTASIEASADRAGVLLLGASPTNEVGEERSPA